LPRICPAMRSSMQKDVEERRPLELAAFNGTVVQLGREHGMRVPINRTIFGALQVVSSGRRLSACGGPEIASRRPVAQHMRLPLHTRSGGGNRTPQSPLVLQRQ